MNPHVSARSKMNVQAIISLSMKGAQLGQVANKLSKYVCFLIKLFVLSKYMKFQCLNILIL